MYCSKCGTKAHDTDNFCGSCGTPTLSVSTNDNVDTDKVEEDLIKPISKTTIEYATPSDYLGSVKVDNLSEDKIKHRDRSETIETPTPSAIINNLKDKDKTNYFKRHWRGELSLVKSYWVNIFCITLIIRFGFLIAEKTKFFEEHLYLSFVLIFTVLIIAVWQLVGLWRSATTYLNDGKNSLWGNLARLAVIVGWLQTGVALADVTKELAALKDIYTNIQLSEETDYETEFRFINNNKELLVTGGIGSNSVNEFIKVANANPNLALIHLNNDGGFISESYEIYKFIKEKGYNTYTSGKCLSACTIMFLGGKQRLISTTAKLGFHSASIGNLDGQDYEFINDEFKHIYQEAGLSESLIAKALSTPAKEFYYPDHQQLLSSNAVNLIVDPKNFGSTPLLTLLQGNNLEKNLLKYKTFSAMKKHYPHLYTSFLNKIKDLIIDGRPINDYKTYSGQFFNSNLAEIIQYSSPEAIEKYVFAQYKMFEIFNSDSPQSCNYHLFPEKIPVPSYSLAKETLAEIDDAAYSLITSKSTKRYIDITKHKERLNEAILIIYEENPSIDSIFEDEIADINDKAGCLYLLGLYEEVWNNSGENPAEIFRYIYSS